MLESISRKWKVDFALLETELTSIEDSLPDNILSYSIELNVNTNIRRKTLPVAVRQALRDTDFLLYFCLRKYPVKIQLKFSWSCLQ